MDGGFQSLMSFMDGELFNSSFSTSPVVDIPSTYDHFSCFNLGAGFMNYQPPNFHSNIVDFGDDGLTVEDTGDHLGGLFIPNKPLSDWNITMGSCLKWISHDHELKGGGRSRKKQLQQKPAEIEMEMYRRRSSMARKRRQKISEKIRCLQKILPWDKKMNIATMLEEAYKYVQFLQAQLLVLQSMPNCICTNNNSHSSSSSSSLSSPAPAPVPTSEMFMYGGGRGGLENLNRQQVLEVVVNSEVAQTVLYSRGWCVYSVEQLILLMSQIQETTKADDLLYQQQMLADDDLLYHHQQQKMLAEDDLLYHHQQQQKMLADDDLLYQQQPKQMLADPPSLS